MGTAFIKPVVTADESSLATWKAIVDALGMLSSLHSNPEQIDDVAQKITDAHKLTQDEKDLRLQAIDTVNKAQSDLTVIQTKARQEKAEAADFCEMARIDAQNTKDEADAYRKQQEDAVKKRWNALDNYKNELDKREIDVQERELEAAALTKDKKDFEAAKKAFLDEKKEWEDDVSARLAKLAAREQARLKA